MDKSAKFKLKLLIDCKRNKVVLAEVNQDFVDVLISLLTLSMGKVAKLLLNHKLRLGCFSNLTKSVSDMGIDYFETEACKSMLLDPKNIKEIYCKRLKLNMNSTDDTSLFMCPKFIKGDLCANAYSSFNTSSCPNCGALMNTKIDVPEEEQVGEVMEDKAYGVFVSCRSSFIVTDDMKVTVSSIGVITKVLKDLGYLGFTDLQETLLDVGFQEVVTLLGCLFNSETPLTSAFIGINFKKKFDKMISPAMLKASGVEPSNSLYSVKVFLRKFDREILYAECNEDFIDSLVSFLVLPLELAYTLSNDNTNLRCVGNLCRSPCRRASASKFYQFPGFYSCSNNKPFNLSPHFSPTYECLLQYRPTTGVICTFARKINRSLSLGRSKIVNVCPNDPKVEPGTSKCGNGFMKKNIKFNVTNDLVITPMNSASIIALTKKMQLRLSDLEEHQLCSILRASLISSSALNGLSNFLTKKVKEET